MTDEPNQGKKIIIDEDWKSQVEAEREVADAQPESKAEASASDIAWPEPSLILLATTLATQAMVALGVVAHPATGKAVTDLPQAKHFIDTLGLLQEKTQGNRTDEETAMMEHTLHELRMAYVAIGQQLGQKPSGE
ncbi:MAG: DUF1844 domain-containing protein [Pirellulales bacterium]|nr:DUF1844 domain-containing protein [Pirellulales bacterium]